MSLDAFQHNAYQNNAFQIATTASTCGFQTNAFQNNAFQVCFGTTASTCGFQTNAFQNNAFQVCAGSTVVVRRIGWPDTLHRRVPRKHLERLLELQKNSNFGRRWFEQYERESQSFARAEAHAAEQEAQAAIAESAKAAAATARQLEEISREEHHRDQTAQLAAVLKLGRDAEETQYKIVAARQAADIAAALRSAIEGYEDDDEVEMLLLH